MKYMSNMDRHTDILLVSTKILVNTFTAVTYNLTLCTHKKGGMSLMFKLSFIASSCVPLLR